MSEKNSDVDRAISSVGGEPFVYHSFGPFTMRPRTTSEMRAFTYNEFGEPEYAPSPVAPLHPPAAQQIAAPPPVTQAPHPIYDALPVVQPPATRPMAPPSMAPPQMPPPMPSQTRAAPRVVSPAPPPHLQPAFQPPTQPTMTAAPVQPMREAAPAAPPPPPFFPLLAAALPSAAEQGYTPYYPPAPPAAEPATYGEVPPAAGYQAPQARSAAPAPDTADRRSLADMFSMLASRSGGGLGGFPGAFAGGFPPPPPGPPPSPASAPSEGQALFRRI